MRSTGGPGPGDIVTCDLGHHELYRVTRHLQRFSLVRADDFERIDTAVPVPKGGEPMKGQCPHCTGVWLKHKPGLKLHLKEDGWWPSA